MIEGIVPAFVVGVSLLGIRKREDTEYLSNSQGAIIKGISSILLVIIHIRERLESIPLAYKILAAGGFLLVSLFFFYSGYGITKRIMNNKEYINIGLPRRICYLIALIVSSETVYYLFETLLFHKKVQFSDLILCLVGVNMLNSVCWTIVAMIVIQIVMWFCFKIGVRRSSLSAIIGCAVYMIISLMRRRAAWEIQSCAAFAFGSLCAEDENRVIDYLENRTRIIFCATVLFMSFSLPYFYEYLFSKDSYAIRIISGTISSITFLISFFFVLYRFSINNCIVRLLGRISTEVYIWHGLIIDIMKKQLYAPICRICGGGGETATIFFSLICIVGVILFSIIKVTIQNQISNKLLVTAKQ